MPIINSLIFIPLSACAICSHLDDVEYSFSKWGWEERSYSMPEVAYQLVSVETKTEHPKSNQQYKCCPICGTFYLYEYSYEYLVNGSEDEVTLTRLTPDDIRGFITEDKYTFLINNLPNYLKDSDPTNRAYAARCMTAHQLEQGNLTEVEKYLLDSNKEIMEGALFQLMQWTNKHSDPRKIEPLIPTLKKASRIPSEGERNIAQYLLTSVLNCGDN